MLEMTPAEIDDLLDDALIGRLCMSGPDGRPYAIPLPFCWAGGALYVRVALTGRKGEILARNDRVCFEIDTFADDLADYASVLVEGRLVEVTDVEERARVKWLNAEKYSRLRRGRRPGHGRSTPPDQLPLRKVVAEQVTGRRKEPVAGPGHVSALPAAPVAEGI